jgi:hypothetical protein
VLGGRTEDVDVELDATLPPAQTVAAFDTFHVMHALAEAAEAARVDTAALRARHASLVAERLGRCVQLATAHCVHRAVRDLLPRVCAAAEARAAVAAVAAGRAGLAADAGFGGADPARSNATSSRLDSLATFTAASGSWPPRSFLPSSRISGASSGGGAAKHKSGVISGSWK